MRRDLFITGLVITAVLVGCAGHFPGAIVPDRHSLPEISQVVRIELDSIKRFTGDATLTVDSPEQSGRVGSAIEVLPQEQAVIRLQSPFGGVVGRMKITPGLFVLYNQKGELQYVGSPQNPGLPGFPDLSALHHDLFSVLMGVITFPDSLNDETVDSNQEGQYIISRMQDDQQISYWVDPGLMKVTKYEEQAEGEQPRLTMEFNNFTNTRGINFPRSIRVIQHQQNRMFSIYYHQIEIERSETSHASRS